MYSVTCRRKQNIDVVLMENAQETSLNAHACASVRVRGLRFGLSLHLLPYYVYASSEGFGESAHMRRLT